MIYDRFHWHLNNLLLSLSLFIVILWTLDYKSIFISIYWRLPAIIITFHIYECIWTVNTYNHVQVHLFLYGWIERDYSPFTIWLNLLKPKLFCNYTDLTSRHKAFSAHRVLKMVNDMNLWLLDRNQNDFFHVCWPFI